jgi:hypothetical protein
MSVTFPPPEGKSANDSSTLEVFTMTINQSLNRFTHLAVSALLTSSFLAMSAATANAATIIKQPGAHPDYSWEFEPHLVFDYDDKHYLEDGIGLGASFAIPVMHQGPIPTINNNMAVKFGFDFIFHGDCDDHWSNHNHYGDCSANSFMIPVALQWNFYITDIITVFGEPGLYFRHFWADWDHCTDADCDDSDNHLGPYMGAGAKFMFGRTAGLTVRTGYPQTTVGATLLF